MKTSTKRGSVALLSLLAALAQAAPAAADEPADDVVYLKSGGRVRGAIMTDDPRVGVALTLADGTVRRLAARDIDRVVYATDAATQSAAAAAPAPAPAAPASNVESAAPAAPAAPPAPAVAFGGWSADPAQDRAAPKTDWKRARQGLSFGLSGGGGYMPGLDAGGGILTAILNVGVGVVDFRFGFGGYAGAGEFGGSVGPLVISETRIHLGSVYSLGAGGLFGMAYDLEREEAGALVGALLTPAAFQFGPSRQFEIALFGGPTYNFETEYLGGVGGQSFSVLFL